MIRPVEGEADLEAYVATWNAVVPDDVPTTVEHQRDRRERDPRRLYLLAEVDGEVVAAAYSGPSDSADRGFVGPRVLPAARRRGIGTELLERLAAHLEQHGFTIAGAHVDGHDTGSVAFAHRFVNFFLKRETLLVASGSRRSTVRSSKCGRTGTSRKPSRPQESSS